MRFELYAVPEYLLYKAISEKRKPCRVPSTWNFSCQFHAATMSFQPHEVMPRTLNVEGRGGQDEAYLDLLTGCVAATWG